LRASALRRLLRLGRFLRFRLLRRRFLFLGRRLDFRFCFFRFLRLVLDRLFSRIFGRRFDRLFRLRFIPDRCFVLDRLVRDRLFRRSIPVR
jgi:hypothetical protein